MADDFLLAGEDAFEDNISNRSQSSAANDLRTTCDSCRRLHRTCSGGDPTTPCDGCVTRNVECVFNPIGTDVVKRVRVRKPKSTTADEQPQAEPNKKRVIEKPSISAPGFNPAALGLRRRCNLCHSRGRACINGSDTTPCDLCKEKNLVCVFGLLGSVVDKDSLIKVEDEDSNDQQSDTEAAGWGYAIEQQLEVDVVEERVPGTFMAQNGESVTFTQEQVRLEEDHSMHPWETLDARQALWYDLMDD